MIKNMSFDIEENGQLVSLMLNNIEYMHGGGRLNATAKEKKIWANTTINMFPIVGPSAGNVILINGREYSMNQHGIARELKKYISRYDDKVVVSCFNISDRKVPNSKFDKNKKVSNENNEFQYWPFNCQIDNHYFLKEEGLLIEDELSNLDDNKEMSYAYGSHIAFKPHSKKGILDIGVGKIIRPDLRQVRGTIDLERIMSFQGNGMLIENTDSLRYVDKNSSRGVEVYSSDFEGKWIVWMPDSEMFCFEPLTRFPIENEQVNMNDGTYKILAPGGIDIYRTFVKPF